MVCAALVDARNIVEEKVAHRPISGAETVAHIFE